MILTKAAQMVVDEIEKGSIQPVYLLYGSEPYLVDGITRRLVEKVVEPDSADFDYETVDGDTVSLEGVLSRAQTPPWMGKWKLVVVKRAPWFKSPTDAEQQVLERYLNEPLMSTVLVFQAGAEVDKRKKSFKSASKYSRLVECLELSEKERGEWINRAAREMGMRMEAAALNHLLHFGGKSLYGLENELLKLSCFSGGKSATIGLNTVKDVSSFRVEDRVFDIMDAVVEGRPSLALNRTREVLGVGIPATKVFYLLVRHYRILHRARLGLDSRLSEREITSSLETAPQVAFKYLRQAERLKTDSLSRGLRMMLDLDVDMKSGKDTPENGLQLLIAALARP
ncbi:MAG: DNA polymerase III subunit delta [Firmicutes bacterium]|nr:DNA polymerase III subunit delta [Bacillota bacterium]